MTKDEFLRQLMPRIAGLPWEEQQRVADYYSEIILDGVECGRAEEEIIAGFGSIDELAQRALEEYAAVPTAPAYVAPVPRRRNPGIRVLIGLAWFFGVIIGIPLAAAAFVLFLCGWIVIFSFFIAGFACILSGGISGISLVFLLPQSPLAALFQFGGGLVAAGIGVLILVGTVHLLRQYTIFSRFLSSRITRVFTRKEVPYAS